MDSAQSHIKYVKLPHEEAVAPEVVAEVKKQLFDGYVQRLVELLDFYDEVSGRYCKTEEYLRKFSVESLEFRVN